jgi:hypothetical protein
MANLAQSAVTIERAWVEGGVSGKEISCRQVTLVLTAQGTVANKITKDVLALSKIEQATPFVKDNNAVSVLAFPSYDGSQLLLADLVTTGVPADFTGTFRGVVKGLP